MRDRQRKMEEGGADLEQEEVEDVEDDGECELGGEDSEQPLGGEHVRLHMLWVQMRVQFGQLILWRGHSGGVVEKGNGEIGRSDNPFPQTFLRRTSTDLYVHESTNLSYRNKIR